MTDTATLTLTAFLEQRIAEDEAVTFALEEYGCPAGCCAPAGWVGHRCLICDTPAEFGGTVEAITAIAREHEERIHQRARVLAECKAHRAIVELCGIDGGVFDDDAEDGIRYDGHPITRALAAIWADHEAYRAEWAL